MRLEEHLKEMLRTEKSEMTKFNPRLLHGIVGLCTECGELVDCASKGPDMDVLNFKEELGDLMWYLSLCVDSLGIRWAKIIVLATQCLPEQKAWGGYVDTIIILSSKLLDIAKCKIYYNRNVSQDTVEMLLGGLLSNVSRIVVDLGSSMDEILDINAKKLRARYPDGYSDDLANNRSTDNERKVMESKDVI